jgi:hypothetical protein
MTHICIYSVEAHAVEFEKKIKDSATVKDEVRIAEGDEYMADLPLVDYERARYEGECRCRGGDWKVYTGPTAFSWDSIAPKEAKE